MKMQHHDRFNGPIRILIVLIVVGLTGYSTAGCGGATQYKRTSVRPNELVWSYDRGLEIEKDGKVVAREKDDWEGLSESVQCVPGALKTAHNSERLSSKGRHRMTAGGIFIIATVLGGLGLVVASAFVDSDTAVPLAFSGLGTVTVFPLAVGTPILTSGLRLTLEGKAAAIDSFYMYNDGYASNPSCTPAKKDVAIHRNVTGRQHEISMQAADRNTDGPPFVHPVFPLRAVFPTARNQTSLIY